MLNLESAGIAATRNFYAHGSAKDARPQSQVRFALTSAVEPLTQKQSYSHVFLEVTRHVPAGAFGPLELQVHRPDDAWLEITPESTTMPALPDSKEPRTLMYKVPIKITRHARRRAHRLCRRRSAFWSRHARMARAGITS